MILIVGLLSFVISFVVLFFKWMYLTKGNVPSGDSFFHLIISEHIRGITGNTPHQ